jgi:tetratricopeptide (TPR) repeat protein
VDAIAERLASRLQAEPNDQAAYDALKAHYRETGDLASLTNLIIGWSAFQTDVARASHGYLEAARLVASTGRHQERHCELLRQAVSADITNRAAVLELLDWLAEHTDSHAVAEFLDQHLRAMEAQPRAHDLMAMLYARLGALWGSTFERIDVARRCYERALELDPTQLEVVEGAHKLATSVEDTALLARVLGARAQLEPELARKLELYHQQSELYLSKLADLDGAVLALRAAHQLAPNDIRIMHQLASCLSRRAARKDGEDAARDLRRVAELHYQIAQAVEREDAIDYLEAALNASPSHEGALQMLEQLAVPLGQTALLPKYWLGYLAHASEGPELDQRRVLMAQAYERAGQLDDAIDCLEQVRTEGLAQPLLAELRSRRGPRSSPQIQRAAQAIENAPSANEERPSAKPPVRARIKSAERPLDAAPMLAQLRRAVRDAIAARRTSEAVLRCAEILELEPGDAEAFALLESYYRKTRDHTHLRELLLSSTQTSGVPVDVRKQRLREVAAISEAKLKDIEGAIEVWRSVVALDPADLEAGKSLKRLLQRTARWDELALVLEREALATQNSDEKANLLAQIAAIHRDKRADAHEAAEALRQLYALRPDVATRDELCDLLLSIGNYADAVPLLRKRAEESSGEREKLRLLRVLADTLENRVVDPEAAHASYEQILQLRPKDAEALERMQRIDETSGNTMRLLSTLERRAALALRSDRTALLVRMAELADRNLDDVERASDYYERALDLEPTREALWDALADVFERRSRFAELADLLSETALAEREPARRSALQVRHARLLRGPLSQPAQAAEVYREVLAREENREALMFLLETARLQGESENVATLSTRLAALSEDQDERRSLLFQSAQVLVTELGRPRDALHALREIVERVDPEYEPAIEWLVELAGNLGDSAALASGLMRRLARSTGLDARIALAKRLSTLYEQELGDRDGAIAALAIWADADPEDITPQRRLRRLLEDAGRFAELVNCCDALTRLEPDDVARERAALDAAAVAWHQLQDVEGAWQRLLPLVEQAHPEGLQLMAALARASDRSEALAALYVRSAQGEKSLAVAGKLWRHAVSVYADDLANPTQALEAALRLLATDLSSRDALTQVEECAALAEQWGRLAPVYDRLLKAAAGDNERIELLTRHADLLERRAKNPSEALDRVLRASALSPDDESLWARAERLAARSQRGPELLAMCEQQAVQAHVAATTVDWLLRAARFAVATADDRVRASAYLEAALAATEADSELWELCVSAATQLDSEVPDLAPASLLRELLDSHRRVAQRSRADVGSKLLLRASRVLHERLNDERAAFDLLRQGSLLFPLEEKLHDALFERAEAMGRLDALDAHLARAVDEAIDPKSAAALLARRARLLEGALGRPDDAASVYAKLLQLRPDDLQAATKLRDSLRRARRFQDLLLVIHKQLQREKNPEERLELLKESAQVWELDLKNRWEALDAWRKVLDFAPRDAEAQRAIARLDRRSLPPPSAADTTSASAARLERQESEYELSSRTRTRSSVPSEARNASVDAEPVVGSAHAQRAQDDSPSSEIMPIDDSQMIFSDPSEAIDVAIDVAAHAQLPRPRRTSPPPPPPNAARALKSSEASRSLPPPLPAAGTKAREPARMISAPPPPSPPRKD